MDENICTDILDCLKTHTFDDLLNYLYKTLTPEESKRVIKLSSNNFKIGLHIPIKIIDIIFFYDCVEAIKCLSLQAIVNKRLDFFKWQINNREYNVDEPNEDVISVNKSNIFSTIISLIFEDRYFVLIEPIKLLLGKLNIDNLCSERITKDSYLYMFHQVIKDQNNPIDVYNNLFIKILDNDTKKVLIYFIAYYFYYHLFNFMEYNVPYVTEIDYINFLKKLQKKLDIESYNQFLTLTDQCFEPNYFKLIHGLKVEKIMNYLFPKCN